MKMRYFVMSLIILILIPIAIAKSVDITLKEGESYYYDARNITLIKLDTVDDKAVICLNNKKEIISDTKAMNGVNIDLAWVRTKDAKLNLKFADCKDCDYGNWDNLDCFDECVNDNDCNDNNDNTKDTCSGRPKKCVHENIAKKMIAENKTKEENKTVEFVETTEPKKIEYKSFTQWIFEKIKNLFNK